MIINRKVTYPIAIDIGNRAVHAAQLKKTRKGHAIRGLVHRELVLPDPDMPAVVDDLLPLLREIAGDRRFRGRRAVVHLPLQNIHAFPVQFQITGTETVEEALVREAREHLPFPLEDAVIDYPSITPVSSEKTYRATVTVMRRGDLEPYLAIHKRAGIDVEAVDFRTTSLIRLHHHLSEFSDNPAILCCVGHTQTFVSIVTASHILAHRIFKWGIDRISDKLSVNLGLGDGVRNALPLLSETGLSYNRYKSRPEEERDGAVVTEMDRVVSQIITPCIEELVYEFHTVINYVRLEEQNPRFEGIFLYGHAAMIKHLDRYLEQKIDIRTQSMNPLKKMAFAEGILPGRSLDTSCFYAPALGLAMRRLPWL